MVFQPDEHKDYKRVESLGGRVPSNSRYKELYIDTEYTELVKLRWKSIAHETMHSFVKRATRSFKVKPVDHMDSTTVDGKVVTYYKNDDPYAKDGNYARTLKEVSPYWSYIVKMKRGEDLLKRQLETLTSLLNLWKLKLKRT